MDGNLRLRDQHPSIVTFAIVSFWFSLTVQLESSLERCPICDLGAWSQAPAPQRCVRRRGLLYGLYCPSRRSNQSAPSAPDPPTKHIFGVFPNYGISPSLSPYVPISSIENSKIASEDALDPGGIVVAAARWRRCAVAELESRFRARGIWIRPLFRCGVRKPCHRRLTYGGPLTELASSGSKIFRKSTGPQAPV